MASNQIPDVVIEGAEIRYPNFEGRVGQYNEKGERNFRLMLPDDIAADMLEDGWNVKRTKPWKEANDEEIANFEPRAYVEVTVRFEPVKPEIYLVSNGMKTLLGAETAFLLDQANIENIDLVVNPYHWTVGAKSGVRAYLKKGYFTIQEDEMDRKYAHVPLAGTTTTRTYDGVGFDD